jgi:ABC-2 type transport system permease protein
MISTGTRRAAARVQGRPGLAQDNRASLRAIGLLWRREMIRLKRNPVRIVMGLVTPLMFLLILGTGLSSVTGAAAAGFREYRAFLFPGILLMAVQAPAMAAGISIVWDRQAGFLRQMLVAPVRRTVLVAGICLGGATTGLVYGVLVMLTAGEAGIAYRPRLLLATLELGMIAFSFTAAAVLAAVSIRRIETFQVVVGLCMMPLLFLSGAMFPAGGLPGWLGVAVTLNPLTYEVDALRQTLGGNAAVLGGATVGPRWFGWAPPVPLELGLIAVLALGALAIATRRFSHAAA